MFLNLIKIICFILINFMSWFYIDFMSCFYIDFMSCFFDWFYDGGVGQVTFVNVNSDSKKFPNCGDEFDGKSRKAWR